MITVPIAQSIRFRPINSDRFNFDNEFKCNSGFIQYVDPSDLQLQFITPDDGETLAFVDLSHNGTRTRIVEESISYIGEDKYSTFTFPFADYENEVCYIEAFSQTPPAAEVLGYRSESFTVESKPTYYKLNWFNTENAFAMDYSAGLVHELYVEAKKVLIPYAGESSIYINQGEKVKLKGQVFRMFQFSFDAPDYMVDQINLAIEHDKFYINEIEFTVDKKPSISQLGTSTICQVSMDIEQKTILGLNSHDAG